ncbi:hypothetical protein F5X96DRAFT_659579 [Biscogniauxia mediterranea]|nr:hypothetical protein F5X96DRAFT_659579 [Biscogniauxia mediterranea]
MYTFLDDNMDYTSYPANDFGMHSYIAYDSMASDDGTIFNGSSQTNKRRRGALDDNTSRKRSKTDEDPVVASEETWEMTYAFEDEIISSEVVDMIHEGTSSSSKDNASEYRKQYKRVIKYLYDDMVESVEGCLGREEADELKFSPCMLLDEDEDEYEYEDEDEVDDDDDDCLTVLDVDVDDLVWPDTYGRESIEQMAELASFAGILSCDELMGLVTGGYADDDIEALVAAYGTWFYGTMHYGIGLCGMIPVLLSYVYIYELMK